ncbi:trichohyalin-like [Palaemon carinicauda]|uniref:trichohyalin-like n=1 Tax=Palaemon carinicauda TaxID=392227 RepID=UPI0035B58E64
MAIRSNSFVNNLLLLAATKESGSFMCYDKSTEEKSVEGLLKMKHLGKRTIDKSIEPVEICPKTKLRIYSLGDLLPFVGRVIKRGEFGDVYELVGKYSDFCLKENRICLDVEVENLLRFQHLAVPKVMGLVKEWEVIIVSRQQMTLWDWARIVRPTKEQVLRVLIALVGILQDFHAEGYCYNYVHPENVMIDLATGGQAPKVSVMDFDFMREIGANPFQRPIVQASQSSGTNTKYCKCFASKILAGEGGTPQTDALSMALTMGFLVSNGVLTVRSPFKKLLDWFAGCYGNESGCSMDTLLVGLNKELDNCSISEMEEWVADQKEISSLENSTSNSNDDEEEGRKDCQQNDRVKEVPAYQQKLGEINDQMSNLDDDLLQRDQELASFRQKADQDKRKNDELRTKTLSRERKFQKVQEENDSLRKEVSRLRESQLQSEEDKLSTQGFEDKQKADLEGKPQDERKHLRREAKEVALRRIRKIAQDEISHEKLDKVYVPVEVRQEAVKEEKTAKKHKVNLEEIEEGLELSEQNENVWKSDNIELELKEYQEANSLRTDGDSATKGDDYAEIRRLDVMGAKQKGDLEGKPQDERKHLRREAKEVALRRIRKIAQDEISHEKLDKVYIPVEVKQEAVKEEKTAKKHKVNLEEIEEGLELSEQNENVWKSDNIELELKEYQEANSLRTDGDSATKGDDYAEIRRLDVMGAKQKGDLEGKPQDERKHLRREAKEVALRRIRKIAQDEISHEKLDKVYIPVEVKQEAVKEEKTAKKHKVNLEEIEEGLELSEQNENVWKSDNIELELKEYQEANSLRTDGDSATKGDDYAEIRRLDVMGAKQKGDLEGKPQDERKHLRREAKEVALRRIRKIAQDEISHEKLDKVYIPVEVKQEAVKEEKTAKKHKVNLEEIEEGLELSEQNENVWKSDNIELELKEYQEANSLRTDGDSATKGDDYAEIRRLNVMGAKQKGDLEGKPQDERKHLRREAKEVALRRIRKIAQDEISHEKLDKVYIPVEVRQEAVKEEKTAKKHKVNLEEIEEGLELSEQNENVWKSDNIELELKEYQEANSLRTDGDSATKGDDYAEIRRLNVMGAKQKGDLEGKPQGERKHLRREAKEVALRRIRKIAQDEISHEKLDKVYVPVEVRQEAVKEEKTAKKHKVNLEEIEEGLELSEQNENVWKSDNIELELKEYQEANSLRTDGDSATKGDDYAEIRRLNVMGAKQKGDLEGKPQDERKHLRREAKEVALRRIRKIAQDEISHEKLDKVYIPVEVRQEAVKEEKTAKKHKVNLEEIEEGLELSEQNENVWKSDNIELELKEYQEANSLRTDGDSATKGDDYAEIRRLNVMGAKQKGDLEGKPQGERKHLRREAKEVALRRIRKIAQDEISHEKLDKVYVPVEVRQEAVKEEKTAKKHKVNLEEIEEGLELSEQNENVWKSDNIELELKEYQEANSLRTDGDSATKGDDYAEIRRLNVMGAKQKGDLEGKPQDERKHLRREAKEVALRRIRKIAQDEISHEKLDKVYIPVEVRQEAVKEEKTAKKHKVNLEEIEEGLELSEQNENVWKSDNIELELKEYQEANSLRTDGDSATKGDDYAEIRRLNVMGAKQKGDLEGKPQGERKHLRREAKEVALRRIRKIAQDEISHEKLDKVYIPVEVRQEAVKEEKTAKKHKVNLEEIEEGLELSEQNENVWKSDNIELELKEYQEANSLRTDGDSATKGDDYAEIRRLDVMGAKQKGDLEGKPQDERKHLRREAKEVALRRIRKIAQDEISHEKLDKVYIPVEVRQEALKEDKTAKKHKVNLEEIEEGLELSEQNENVWKSDNIELELKEYQEANSLRTDGDSATKGDDYAETRVVNAMGAKGKGDLEGKPQDEKKHLRREIDDIVELQKRELLRREEESKRLDKELIEERRIRKKRESEVHRLKKEIKSLKQRLLAKTGQIGDTHKVVMELADLMNQLKEEVNSDD